MHPPSVYQALTGVYDDDKTEDDVLEKLIEIAVGRLAVKEEKHGQRIRYVDTPLIEQFATDMFVSFRSLPASQALAFW